jgi:hypothetical protein
MSGFIAAAPFFQKKHFIMKVSNTLRQYRLWHLGGLLAADFILFGFTNAQNVNPLLLIIGYCALILTTYQIAKLLLKRRRAAFWLAGVSAGVVALQSMGGLSQRDWAVILPLTGLGYLYSAYLAKAV